MTRTGARDRPRIRWLLVCAALVQGCAPHRQPSIRELLAASAPAVDGRQDPRGPGDAFDRTDSGLRDRLDRLEAAPSAQAHHDVAIEYLRLGVEEAAFDHLTMAIKLDPKDAASFDSRARLWRRWRLPEFGLPDARRATALAPTSATAWNTLGLLLEDTGSTNEGIGAYQRAVELDDQAAYAWSNLCRVWTLRQDAPSAIQACHRAVALDPASASSERHLAEAEKIGSLAAAAAVTIGATP